MKFRVKSLPNISMTAVTLSGSRVPGYSTFKDINKGCLEVFGYKRVIELGEKVCWARQTDELAAQG